MITTNSESLVFKCRRPARAPRMKKAASRSFAHMSGDKSLILFTSSLPRPHPFSCFCACALESILRISKKRRERFEVPKGLSEMRYANGPDGREQDALVKMVLLSIFGP